MGCICLVNSNILLYAAHWVSMGANSSSQCRQVFVLLCLSALVIDLFPTIIFISEHVGPVHLHVRPSRELVYTNTAVQMHSLRRKQGNVFS